MAEFDYEMANGLDLLFESLLDYWAEYKSYCTAEGDGTAKTILDWWLTVPRRFMTALEDLF